MKISKIFSPNSFLRKPVYIKINKDSSVISYEVPDISFTWWPTKLFLIVLLLEIGVSLSILVLSVIFIGIELIQLIDLIFTYPFSVIYLLIVLSIAFIFRLKRKIHIEKIYDKIDQYPKIWSLKLKYNNETTKNTRDIEYIKDIGTIGIESNKYHNLIKMITENNNKISLEELKNCTAKTWGTVKILLLARTHNDQFTPLLPKFVYENDFNKLHWTIKTSSTSQFLSYVYKHVPQLWPEYIEEINWGPAPIVQGISEAVYKYRVDNGIEPYLIQELEQ